MAGAAIGAAAVGGGMAAASGALNMYFTHLQNKKAWHRQKKVLQKQIQWRVQDAKKAGIHPLAALGITPASGPGVALGEGMGDIGVAAGRAVRSYEEVRLAEIAREQEEVKTENLRLDGQIKSEYLDQMRNKGVGTLYPTGDPIIDGLHSMGAGNVGNGAGPQGMPSFTYRQNEIPAFGSPGHSGGIRPAQQTYLDQDGFVVEGQDMIGAQSMQSDLGHRLGIYVGKLKRMFKNEFHFLQWMWNKPEAMKWYKSAVKKLPPLPEGAMYIYHPSTNQWQAVSRKWLSRKVREYQEGKSRRRKYNEPTDPGRGLW